MKFQRVFICMAVVGLLVANAAVAQLGRMEFEDVTGQRGGQKLVLDPNIAVLVVYAPITGMSFSTNNGSIIKVDDSNAGSYILHLRPGTHILSMSAPEFETGTYKVNIPPKEAREVEITVITGPGGRGSVHLETNPPGAKIVFNNIPLNKFTPDDLLDQPTGRHLIRFELNGYMPFDTEIDISTGQKKTFRFNLVKAWAGLKVTSDPEGATVYLDGDNLGITPLDRTDLTPKEGIIIVEKEGYVPNTQPIRLAAGKTQELNLFLMKQTGTAEITTSPSGATIYVDGQMIGVSSGTPTVIGDLALGTHTVRAEKPGFEPIEQTFEVKFNTMQSIRLNLEGRPGGIFVLSVPKGAAIVLNGKWTGKRTTDRVEDLAPGTYELLLQLEGYMKKIDMITVEPEKITTKTYNLEEGYDNYITLVHPDTILAQQQRQQMWQQQQQQQAITQPVVKDTQSVAAAKPVKKKKPPKSPTRFDMKGPEFSLAFGLDNLKMKDDEKNLTPGGETEAGGLDISLQVRLPFSPYFGMIGVAEAGGWSVEEDIEPDVIPEPFTISTFISQTAYTIGAYISPIQRAYIMGGYVTANTRYEYESDNGSYNGLSEDGTNDGISLGLGFKIFPRMLVQLRYMDLKAYEQMKLQVSFVTSL